MLLFVILNVISIFPNYLSCLLLKINGDIVISRSIMTSTISTGLLHLLKNGQYNSIAKMLKFPTFDFKPAYYSAISDSNDPLIAQIYIAHISGIINEEDSRILLPSDLVVSESLMEELRPDELNLLPLHPFVGDQNFMPHRMNEATLISAINRGIIERDIQMNWISWLISTPLKFENVWNHPEIWKILLMETFCNSHFPTKKRILLSLKESVERVDLSVGDLLLINVTVVSFYFELCRLIYEFNDASRTYYGQLWKMLDEMKTDFSVLFQAIIDNKSSKELDPLILKGLNLNSASIIFDSDETLKQNQFYYAERLELFVKILEILKEIPNIFGDWFINLFSAFYDIIPKMPLKLLIETWKLFLSSNPTIKSISTMFSWFQNRISEDFRCKLAEIVPNNLMILLFKRDYPLKHIPSTTNLLPYNVRKAEYLKRNTLGTTEPFYYDLSEVWTFSQANLSKLLRVFQYIEMKQLDLFESIDTFFIIDMGLQEGISMKKFIEIVLNIFISIKDWYFELDSIQVDDSSHSSSESSTAASSKELNIPVIIPSPLFPSSFSPVLAQLIIKCRHLNCKSPFRISEAYLVLSQNYIFFSEASKLNKFVQSQMKYMTQPYCHLPRLTLMYMTYFNMMTSFQPPNQSEFENNDYSMRENHLYNHYLSLFRTINYLRSSTDWDLTTGQADEIETKLNEVSSKTLTLFGNEIYKLIELRNVFDNNELYLFLYN